MGRIIYIPSVYKEEIFLNEDALDYLKKNKVKAVSLFASVQFLSLDRIKKQLEENKIKILNSSPQILGCNLYLSEIKSKEIKTSDLILYIGDGMFHPKTILLSQLGTKFKDVLCFNPKTNNFSITRFKDVEKIILILKTNLLKFIYSKKIGVLISLKPGQRSFEQAINFKKENEKKGKKVYLFVDNSFNFDLLENFNFIDFWVNSACPRIGLDDAGNIKNPIINIQDAKNPEKSLERINKTLELNGKSTN
jgi:2-(3-amino-3-carboxypropyl)histidine synthase